MKENKVGADWGRERVGVSGHHCLTGISLKQRNLEEPWKRCKEDYLWVAATKRDFSLHFLGKMVSFASLGLALTVRLTC